LVQTEKEEHRLRLFENRLLRRIFGPKRDEVMGGWRKLHNEEHRDFYSSPSKIRTIKSRRMRLVWHAARMREKRNAYRLLVGKTDRRRPLGRPRHSLVNNSKMDFGEKVCSGVDWIGLAQDRDKLRALMNVVMNLQAP
jgi:hypothetical protein